MKKLFLIIIPAILVGSAFIMLTPKGQLTVTSRSFNNNDTIPTAYTCEGPNVNPELSIEGIPEKTKSLALIVYDPDAAGGTVDHWIMWNIPPASMIAEASATGIQGKNVNNENTYTGPCPPEGTHHYHFKVYALDKTLSLKEGADKASLQLAMEDHILASGELIGLYKKKSTPYMGGTK